VCRWRTTASHISYGFGWGDRCEGSTEDPLPSPRAPQDKKIRWTNAKHHDRVAIQRLADAIVGAGYCHTVSVLTLGGDKDAERPCLPPSGPKSFPAKTIRVRRGARYRLIEGPYPAAVPHVGMTRTLAQPLVFGNPWTSSTLRKFSFPPL
jgi:hypothetical protein